MIIFNTAEVRRSNRISHTVLFRLFSQLNSRGTHSISSILPLSSGWISFMISTTRWASSWSRIRSANVPCTRGLGGRFAPLIGTNVSMCSIVTEQAGPMLVSIREDQIGPRPDVRSPQLARTRASQNEWNASSVSSDSSVNRAWHTSPN